MKLLNYLTYKSFFIIKIIFSLSLLTLIILNYFVLDKLTYSVLYLFFLITGVFIGYSIAFFSIKLLQAGQKS